VGVAEVRIGGDPVEVVVLPEVGARIHGLRAFGHQLIRTPEDTETHRLDPFFWGAYVMAPWCNRLEPRPTVVGGRTVDLAANFRDGSAIHGQVYDRPWTRDDDGSFRVRGGGDGWPWRYLVAMDLGVIDATLSIALTLTNLDDEPMPAGIGIHPWFRRPLEVAIHADRVHASMHEMTPDGEPVAGRYDVRSLGPIADDLDATWSGLADPPVELRWPDAGVRATLRAVAPALHVVAASPSAIDAVAVEPQTHLPQGLRRMLAGQPGALVMLDPGASLALGVVLTFESGVERIKAS
jgi:aldose 1-epimerase